MRLNFVGEDTFCIESQFPAGDALVIRAGDVNLVGDKFIQLVYFVC